MKYILFSLLFFTAVVQAQNVNVPDANFKAKLLEADLTNTIAYGNGGYIKIDADNDGEIQVVEAQAVDSLNVPFSEIADITGILNFINLKKLDCSNNTIPALDLTGITALKHLDCSNNQITGLALTGFNQLDFLNCSVNQIPALNLSGLTNLSQLDCNNNLINTINLSGCTNLYYLSCSENSLTALDLSGLVNLKHLDFFSNSLTSIDLSQTTQLEFLNCANTTMTSIDVSSLLQLQEFYTNDSSLISIDISNLTALTYFGFGSPALQYLFMKNGVEDPFGMSQCANLQYVCGDEEEIAFIANNIPFTASNPNAVINSYCSFIPGGNYNTITGNIKFDADNNGCDTNDISQSNMRVNINDDSNDGAVFTNNTGDYHFYGQSGNFTITPALENPTFFDFSPPNALVNFSDNNNNTATENFCITANGIHPDLEVMIVPLTGARPGFDADYILMYRNKGNQTLSGAVTLAFDDARTDFVSANPTVDNQTLGMLSWNFTNLHPFENKAIRFVLNMNSPLETPPLNLGDILHFTARITDIVEETPEDNIFELNQTVVNAIDPNDKTCLEGNTIAASEIGKYVHYNINFENVGTADAINVVVKDVIDTTKFDMNSLQLLYASHPVETKIRGNVVEFIFENINLPPSNIEPIGGHGNVLFKIKTQPTLSVGDEIANTANIYFDYNAPIETNEARSAYQNLSSSGFTKDNSISIHPNPTKNTLSIQANSNIKSIELYDVQGRILQSRSENKNTATFDISDKANGVYFLKINSEKGSSVEKIMKE